MFFDTNVLIYIKATDTLKTPIARAFARQGGVISVQSLNELVSVSRGKLKLPWPVLHGVIKEYREMFRVEPLTVETHEMGVSVSERYGFKIYDSLLLAAAIMADCRTFLSEDMQHGQMIDGRLTITNPFL